MEQSRRRKASSTAFVDLPTSLCMHREENEFILYQRLACRNASEHVACCTHFRHTPPIGLRPKRRRRARPSSSNVDALCRWSDQRRVSDDTKLAKEAGP